MISWFRPGSVSADADLRLFFFPPAGAGASIYADWLRLLPADIAGQALQLPGRQDRIREPAIEDFATLITHLVAALEVELDDRPYAFFGHSMGALLAYRTAVVLQRAGGRGPALVAASGWAPRGVAVQLPDPERMNDGQVVAWMSALGSIPPGIAAAAELLALAAPSLRADIAACFTYQDDGAILRCPLLGYGGAEDPLLDSSAMISWAERCTVFLGNRTFPGGHFFLLEHGLDIVLELTTLLRRHARVTRA